MQQMIWRWKAWRSAKLFGMYCFSQFFTVLSQFRKWRKTYFWRNFYKIYWNGANNIPLKSYGKCETFSCWWFSLILSRFQVRRDHSFCLYRETDSSKMHRVKNLNFSARVPKLHSVFHVIFLLVGLHPLLVTLHPFTGIEQVIYRWKAAVNMQLSRINRFFILATILKVFHLKFIHYGSRTSCCFHVELLSRIFICNFSPIRRCCTNDIPFVQTSLTMYFLTFSDRGLELTKTKNLDLAFLFIFLILNTHHVVHELFPFL